MEFWKKFQVEDLLFYCYNVATCKGKPTFGLCEKIIRGYTVEETSGQCKEFQSKGCDMTGNGFETKEECGRKCRGGGKLFHAI